MEEPVFSTSKLSKGLLVAALNFAISNGPFRIRLPVEKLGDAKFRNLQRELTDHIFPSVTIDESKKDRASLSTEKMGNHVDLVLCPTPSWPAFFLLSSWVTVRTGSRRGILSASLWEKFRTTDRPDWSKLANPADAEAMMGEVKRLDLGEEGILEMMKPEVGSEVQICSLAKVFTMDVSSTEVTSWPEESATVEYKTSSSWPLTAEELAKITSDNFMPTLRSGEDFSFSIGVHDSLQPLGLVLEEKPGDVLDAYAGKVLAFLLSLAPPLGIAQVAIVARPVQLLCPSSPLCMMFLSANDGFSGSLKAIGAAVVRKLPPAFLVLQWAGENGEIVYGVAVEGEPTEDSALPDHYNVVPRFIISLSLAWRSAGSPIIIRDSAMAAVPRLRITAAGCLKAGNGRLCALDALLWAHRLPNATTMDLMTNELIKLVAVCLPGQVPTFVEGVVPDAVLQAHILVLDSEKEAIREKLEGYRDNSQPFHVLLVDPVKGWCDWVRELNVTELSVQTAEGTSTRDFFRELDETVLVLDFFAHPSQSAPALDTSAQLAGYNRHQRSVVTPSDVALEDARGWIEGRQVLQSVLLSVGLASPLNGQLDRLVGMIRAALATVPATTQVVIATKLFSCCGATTLLRMAAMKVAECGTADYYEARGRARLTPAIIASFAHGRRPAIFLEEDMDEELIAMAMSAEASFPIVILTSQRGTARAAWQLRGVFAVNPIVSTDRVADLRTSLVQMYPEAEQELADLPLSSIMERHVLVFVLTSLRATYMASDRRVRLQGRKSSAWPPKPPGIRRYVAEDVASVRLLTARDLLFAIAFASSYGSRGCDGLPIADALPDALKPLCRLGSLLVLDKTIVRVWHPLLARMLLVEMGFSVTSPELLRDKKVGLLGVLNTLDIWCPLFGRKFVRDVLVTRAGGKAGRFSKLIYDFRAAVDGKDPRAYFPDIAELAQLRKTDVQEFKSAMHVLLSRLCRLHFCKMRKEALREAKAAVEAHSSYSSQHNLARVTLDMDTVKGLELLHALTKRTSKKQATRTKRSKLLRKTAVKFISNLRQSSDAHFKMCNLWGVTPAPRGGADSDRHVLVRGSGNCQPDVKEVLACRAAM